MNDFYLIWTALNLFCSFSFNQTRCLFLVFTTFHFCFIFLFWPHFSASLVFFHQTINNQIGLRDNRVRNLRKESNSDSFLKKLSLYLCHFWLLIPCRFGCIAKQCRTEKMLNWLKWWTQFSSSLSLSYCLLHDILPRMHQSERKSWLD